MLDNITRMMEMEETKHRDRVARLERVEELMKDKGDPEGEKEAKSLIESENQRHDRKMEMLKLRYQEVQERHKMMMESGGQGGRPMNPAGRGGQGRQPQPDSPE